MTMTFKNCSSQEKRLGAVKVQMRREMLLKVIKVRSRACKANGMATAQNASQQRREAGVGPSESGITSESRPPLRRRLRSR